MRMKIEESQYCYYCGRKYVHYGLTKVQEHFIPLSRGGTNALTNKVVACKHCDDLKANLLPGELKVRVNRMISKNRPGHYTHYQLRRILYAIEMFDICYGI